MNIITLEVMSDSSNIEPIIDNYGSESTTEPVDTLPKSSTGVHFLTEQSHEETDHKVENTKDENAFRGKTDLLEYMMRSDGSVICKMCGEVLQSRTHWYRHKYKLHVVQPLNPAPLFQCEQCLVYFKSRKGYIGHIASRHSELLSDSSPVLSNSQLENSFKESVPVIQELKEDPELVIPKTSVPNYQTAGSKHVTKSTETKKPCRTKEQLPEPDWKERRSREEKLVADIIDRVRRECEAQQGSGSGGGPARRGYTRRTTVMNT